MATVRCAQAMVASTDQLATSAGVAMLRAGGSAVDAAIATNAVLAVTAPNLCGMGGDLFALVHTPTRDTPATLNASGRAGSGADAQRLRDEGHTRMPFRGDIRSAPVPGCVDGWLALHARFGRLDLGDVFAPAITYARDGFPASIILAFMAAELKDVANAGALAEPITPGAPVVRAGVARALEAIVAQGRDGFYGGEFGAGLLALGGGELVEADLQSPLADWVDPLKARVWGHDVWTTPPGSQGYLTLLSATIAEGLPLPDDPRDGAWAHLLVESARAAAHDRTATLYDGADVTPLLAPEAVAARRRAISLDGRARFGAPATSGDTTYLCAVDDSGMGVSLIQSNAKGFGSLVFEPATGIGLHNRGTGFSLEPGHPAEYGPGRRPPHTLSPALITRPDGSLHTVFGTMGGDGQPQILLQVLARLLRRGSSPGTAIDAPRWVLSNGTSNEFATWVDPDAVRVEVERAGADTWEPALTARGHDVHVVDGVAGQFGASQAITVEPTGYLAGAADPRSLTGAAQGY